MNEEKVDHVACDFQWYKFVDEKLPLTRRCGTLAVFCMNGPTFAVLSKPSNSQNEWVIRKR